MTTSAMSDLEAIKSRLRPYYTAAIERSPTARVLAILATGQIQRSTAYVRDGYMNAWGAYEAQLDRARTLDEWLCVPGHDDAPSTHVEHGKVTYGSFDTNRYWIDEVEKTIRAHFPEARSITEYGCGVGRNLLRLKQRFPHWRCYGYELADAGVQVARRAAEKFGLDVRYAQLDYIRDGADRYVHPPTDLALTVFSLEQIPHASPVAVRNMLDRSTLGSIHVEPVCENYPKSYLGLLGRLYTRSVDYLQNFDASVRAFGVEVHARTLDISHNPLIPTPSVYALVK